MIAEESLGSLTISIILISCLKVHLFFQFSILCKVQNNQMKKYLSDNSKVCICASTANRYIILRRITLEDQRFTLMYIFSE